MEESFKRKCPSCKNKTLELEQLKSAKIGNPAICSKCGNGYVLFNVYFWPFYALIDAAILVLGFIILGGLGFIVAAFIIPISFYLIKNYKINEKYGWLVWSENIET